MTRPLKKQDLTRSTLPHSFHSVRLDRTSFKKQSFDQAAEHQTAYKAMSPEQRGESFKYLMQVNYGFLGKDWPKMERTVFSKRCRE
jgi:hypothetical protein